MELRGLPPYVGIPPFSRCVGLSGTNLGTLRGFSLASVQAPAHGVSRAVNPLHFYPHCSFLRGEGVPPRYAGLSCVRSTGAGHQAKQWPVAFLFHVFFTFFFLFLDFLHFRHIHVFCEEGVKMCFFLFWLFSAVFLCGRFQYGVRNRWNSAVFVFSTVFVWTIPVLWYTNKSYFCNFCV